MINLALFNRFTNGEKKLLAISLVHEGGGLFRTFVDLHIEMLQQDLLNIGDGDDAEILKNFKKLKSDLDNWQEFKRLLDTLEKVLRSPDYTLEES